MSSKETGLTLAVSRKTFGFVSDNRALAHLSEINRSLGVVKELLGEVKKERGNSGDGS